MATQTGTGIARDWKVLRSRLEALYTESGTDGVWWPEDTTFTPPTPTDPAAAPASFLRPVRGRTFGETGTFEGSEDRVGSWQLFSGVQARPGSDEKRAAIELEIRAIADPGQNDDAEDVWTLGPIEINPDTAPPGISDSVRRAFIFDQYVIPYEATEIGR